MHNDSLSLPLTSKFHPPRGFSFLLIFNTTRFSAHTAFAPLTLLVFVILLRINSWNCNTLASPTLISLHTPQRHVSRTSSILVVCLVYSDRQFLRRAPSTLNGDKMAATFHFFFASVKLPEWIPEEIRIFHDFRLRSGFLNS